MTTLLRHSKVDLALHELRPGRSDGRALLLLCFAAIPRKISFFHYYLLAACALSLALAYIFEHYGPPSIFRRPWGRWAYLGVAAAAFARITAYDRAISTYFASRIEKEDLPGQLDLSFERRSSLEVLFHCRRVTH